MSVDPSLSCTGAVTLEWTPASSDWMNGYETGTMQGFKFKPDDGESNFVERARDITAKLMRLCGEFGPDRVLVEVPEGNVNMGHTGGGAGLSKYGFMAGMAFMALNAIAMAPVTPVGASYWTSGMSKAKRRKKAASAFPLLLDMKDSGYDISDAAAMAVWWLEIGKDKELCLSL